MASRESIPAEADLKEKSWKISLPNFLPVCSKSSKARLSAWWLWHLIATQQERLLFAFQAQETCFILCSAGFDD